MKDIYARGGMDNPFLYPIGYVQEDTVITAGTHLTSTTAISFLPFSLPPRTRILRGFVGGGTTPTSGTTASMQFQALEMDETAFTPGALIGSTTTIVLAGTGNVVDTTAPPYVGHNAGANWWAPFTLSGVENPSRSKPRLIMIGSQIEGGGAMTAGTIFTIVRNVLGPSYSKIAAAAYPYTFVASPTVVGQTAGELVARPNIVLQLERVV